MRDLDEGRDSAQARYFKTVQKRKLFVLAINVRGSVPGGVYSDLRNAGVIGDILYGFNDVLTRWVAHDTWTYTGLFNGKYG